MISNRKITKYADGTLKIEVESKRTLKDDLLTLSFQEKLDIMYPTDDVDYTIGWLEFDNHKRSK